MKKWMLCAIAFCAGVLCGRFSVTPEAGKPGTVTVLVRRDTVTVPRPVPVYVQQLPPTNERLPLASDCADSADVTVERRQLVYRGEDYEAYVSGFRASLDSLKVFRRLEIRERTVAPPVKNKRFSVGLQAGYGYTPRGFQPYIGVGVSVNLFSF